MCKELNCSNFQPSLITGKPVILFSTRSSIASSTVIVGFTTCKSSLLVIKSPTVKTLFFSDTELGMKVVSAVTLKDLRRPEVATEVRKSLRPGRDSSGKHCSQLAGAEAEEAERVERRFWNENRGHG
ncbi:hypothetical protein C1H46_000133 [Malus baccata]|uniref:Uncharacterized protein n=1 Tax=Malus baccata TaxID=106549 RepID=A0A540NT47_MALBA|nr:hypothetical protein C1H46_000133 [Malus baccata]